MLDIVHQQLLGVDDDGIILQDGRAVLIGLDQVVVQLGRVVDRCDREADPSGRGCTIAVADHIIEVGSPPIVVARRDGDEPVRSDIDLHFAIRLHRFHNQCIAVDIGVVGK